MAAQIARSTVSPSAGDTVLRSRLTALYDRDGYSAARIAFQVSTYLPMRGGSFQKSSPSA